MPLHQGLGTFRKVIWVQRAVNAALLMAYGIGTTEPPRQTTHALRIHFSFNFLEEAPEDQFTLHEATLETHAATAKALNAFILSSVHSAHEFSQVELKRMGGAAIAALPPNNILLPVVYTASFGDEVMNMVPGRSATRYTDTFIHVDDAARTARAASLVDGFPAGIRPPLTPPPDADWAKALKRRLDLKGVEPAGGLFEGTRREQQRWLDRGCSNAGELWTLVARIRNDLYGWDGPEVEDV